MRVLFKAKILTWQQNYHYPCVSLVKYSSYLLLASPIQYEIMHFFITKYLPISLLTDTGVCFSSTTRMKLIPVSPPESIYSL